MSTVCYCGRPDCSVTSMARDACVANLRAERDALKAQVEAVAARRAREVPGGPMSDKEFEDAVLLTWLVAALAISVFVAVLEGDV